MSNVFVVGDPEETVFELKSPEGKILASVDAIDVITEMESARRLARDKGDGVNWHPFFQKSFHNLCGVRLSKTQAAMLFVEAQNVFNSLKKSGLEDTKPSEPSEAPSNPPSETSE